MPRHIASVFVIILLSFMELYGYPKTGPGIRINTVEKNINCLSFSGGGSLLAFGDGARLKILNMSDKQVINELSDAHTGKILSIDFSPDSSMVVSGGSDGIIVIWYLRTNECKKLDYHTGKVTAVKFDPSGEYIYSASTDKRIVCYSLRDDKTVFDIIVHSSIVLALDITENGQYLASSGADNCVYIISTRDGKIINNLSGPTNWVRCIKFSDNNSTLATGCDNGRIYFWNTKDPLSSFLYYKSGKMRTWITSIDYFHDNTSYCYSVENGSIGINIAGTELRLKLKCPVRMTAIQPGNRTFYQIAVATYGDGLLIIDGNSFTD